MSLVPVFSVEESLNTHHKADILVTDQNTSQISCCILPSGLTGLLSIFVDSVIGFDDFASS